MTDLQKPVIVWFRNDLRIEDNPALHAARESGRELLAFYVWDPDAAMAPGGAQKWWLHASLSSLSHSLEKLGCRLVLRRGDEATALRAVVAESNAGAVFWNRRYYKRHRDCDAALKTALQDDGVDVQTFNGLLLREPWEVRTGSDAAYKVFTPFWKALKAMGPARPEPKPKIGRIDGARIEIDSDELEAWELQPTRPNWASEFETVWTPGERGANDRLELFLRDNVDNYDNHRNRPDLDETSRLSPHLAFGEISPLTVWRKTYNRLASQNISEKSGETFLSEIAWREFSYVQLFYHEDLPSSPINTKFEKYPWRDAPEHLQAWRRGLTGYPIVDAGMRQLWRTGWMHNRVRMIVGSFLIKDLLLPWQEGLQWFQDCLVDHDIASNAASWQWVAGCGADAAPYFRIFNPVTQSERFDSNGDYIRKFVPELADLTGKHIHAPWKAPNPVLEAAGVDLGGNYPHPIVDHGEARQQALDGYNAIKGG